MVQQNPELSFRKGTAADTAQLHRLGLISYGQYADLLTSDNWQKLHSGLNDESKWLSLVNNSHCFVALHREEIVGMAFLVPNGNPWDIFKAEWSYLRMVGVHPQHQGKGIAKTLTGQCIRQARQSGEKIIALHTSEFMDAARHIYESAGFKILHEIEPRFGKKYWLYTLDL